ncbi:MAG TPA: hypothetical protein VE954_35695, partial [Oligoflexus sp.]|nr:hypothetical protein [Oligoflexus sp.]
MMISQERPFDGNTYFSFPYPICRFCQWVCIRLFQREGSAERMKQCPVKKHHIKIPARVRFGQAKIGFLLSDCSEFEPKCWRPDMKMF